MRKKKKQIQRSKHQKQIRRKIKQRIKKTKQLAKILKQQHRRQLKQNSHRKIVAYKNRHGLELNKFQPRYPLQSFKSQNNNWKLVKTCRTQSFKDIIFYIVDYNKEKDYFLLNSQQLGGSYFYRRDELQPYTKSKKAKLKDFLEQASKIITESQRVGN